MNSREKVIEEYIDLLRSLGMKEPFIKLSVIAFASGYDASTLVHKGEVKAQDMMFNADNYIIH